MSANLMKPSPVDLKFKICSYCEQGWERLEDFIQDPHIDLAGYMPAFDDLMNGLVLFNHGCGTTLACRVGHFRHLYDGPVYQERKTAASECPGYCLNKTDLNPCPVKCNCAYVREVLLILKAWPKDRAA